MLLPTRISAHFSNTVPKTDLIEFFNNINKILSKNGVIPLTPDSEIIKILTTNIYPYFSIYSDINLNKIKTIITGIFNIQYNLNSNFQIFKMINDKAKQERL